MQHNVIFDKEVIAKTLIRLATDIEVHYGLAHEEHNLDRLIVVVLMDGAFMFAADLLRALSVDIELVFVGAASYGHAIISSGDVQITMCSKEELVNLEGAHVLVIDDIFDTGQTIAKVISVIKDACTPASITSCCLLYKKSVTQESPHFYGLIVEKEQFVYGYGLDLFGKYRHLPTICEYQQA